MSRPPPARASQGGSLAPFDEGLPQSQSRRASSMFPPQGPPNGQVISRPHSRMEPPPLSATVGPMPGTVERPIQGPRKRLIVTCDGTWLDDAQSIVGGQQQPPSNVSRIGWAMKETSRDGIPQIVHYQAGVASSGSYFSRLYGGAVGAGLKENCQEAYSYIAINWRPGDEIFIIGFSRGAFTARSIAGMIGDIGLLTRTGLPFFSEIFEDFEHRNNQSYVSKFPDTPFPHKGPFDNRYVAELERLGMTRTRIQIKAVAVWETVGSLGIPRLPWLQSVGLQNRKMKDYAFYDTSLNPCIENAFQALALDEHRAPFSPAVWEKRNNDRTNLKQVWFPGVHSNVGGGYDDQELANITLAWMISRLEPFIDFAPEYILSCFESNKAYYKSTGQRTRNWSFGELYNSVTKYYVVSGKRTRTPGDYYRVDPYNGAPTDKHLKNTNEYIHASVRARLGLQGPGTADRGLYEPAALRDWTYAVEVPGQGGAGMQEKEPMIVWTNHNENFGGQKQIPEAVLLDTERKLLGMSSKVEEYVLDMRQTPKKEKRRSRKVRPDEPPAPPNGLGVPSQAPPAPAGFDRDASPPPRQRRRRRR